uniref:Predicted protein n=1 Tax=Hordeum vulgare subsp. vulgare TaxID=112509 RepID=F2DFC0_HORVV|nr:predicted protein [Hordeum vulgare subsp. vulgare]
MSSRTLSSTPSRLPFSPTCWT